MEGWKNNKSDSRQWKVNYFKKCINEIDKTTEDLKRLLSGVYTDDFTRCLKFSDTTIANRYICNTTEAKKQIEELEIYINKDLINA